MIIGSGLLAKAFVRAFMHSADVCIYAAGVSNSGCNDLLEFDRERKRLADALRYAQHVDAFVYFGTCSVADPDTQNTPYVQHKLAMEKLVHSHSRNLVLRLPQVAGETSNPNTLLNFLHTRIARSEAFELWINAKRNIIDVDDVAIIAKQLIADNSVRNRTLNIANTVNYHMAEIVTVMEQVVGKRAIYHIERRGSEYYIDTRSILPVLERTEIKFGGDYLEKAIFKYYKNLSPGISVVSKVHGLNTTAVIKNDGINKLST